MNIKPVIAITGPSGAGKTTLSNYLKSLYGYSYPVHTTTRLPREDDMYGFYRHIDNATFESLALQGEFLYYSGYKGRYYGILKKDFIDCYNNSNGLIININYMDLSQIERLKEEYNIIVIRLAFEDLENMIIKRTMDRGQTKEDTLFRIEVAQINEVTYRDEINRVVDISYYTDTNSFSDEVDYITKKIGEKYDSKRY